MAVLNVKEAIRQNPSTSMSYDRIVHLKAKIKQLKAKIIQIGLEDGNAKNTVKSVQLLRHQIQQIENNIKKIESKKKSDRERTKEK